MKDYSLFLRLLTVVIMAGSFSACNKSATIPDQQCHLQYVNIVANYYSDVYVFTYDSLDRVTGIELSSRNGTSRKNLTYSENQVVINTMYPYNNPAKQVLTLNNYGKVLRLENREPTTDSILSYTDYYYNVFGWLTGYAAKEGNKAVQIATVTNVEDNVTSITTNVGTTYFTFNPNKDWLAGDYIDLQQRISFGNNYYLVNKNLLKSEFRAKDTTYYNYVFDDKNNISSLEKIDSGRVTKITYVHDCK